MTMPNFLIIGAARSGTTALWEYLRKHPQVYTAVPKHTRFFASQGAIPHFRGPRPPGLGPISTHKVPYAITSIEDYRKLFDGVINETAIGEASHSYLYTPGTAERIWRCLPTVKLVAILRNPIDRAYSHFWYLVQHRREPLTDFVRALNEEESGMRDDWWPDFRYIDLGRYYKQLKPYFELFDRSQIKVYLHEDLRSATLGTVQDVFRFLAVDNTFVPDVAQKYNASGIPRNRVLETLLGSPSPVKRVLRTYLSEEQRSRISSEFAKLRTRNLSKPPPLSVQTRKVLVERYREDISHLQSLIQRDLSAWLEYE